MSRSTQCPRAPHRGAIPTEVLDAQCGTPAPALLQLDQVTHSDRQQRRSAPPPVHMKLCGEAAAVRNEDCDGRVFSNQSLAADDATSPLLKSERPRRGQSRWTTRPMMCVFMLGVPSLRDWLHAPTTPQTPATEEAPPVTLVDPAAALRARAAAKGKGRKKGGSSAAVEGKVSSAKFLPCASLIVVWVPGLSTQLSTPNHVSFFRPK